MKRITAIVLICVFITVFSLSAFASSGMDIANISTEYTPTSQNKGATTITSDNGALTYTTPSWDGVVYSVWQQTFTAAELDANLYLNLEFSVSGNGGSRITLDFNEGKALLAELVKDDYDTIATDDSGNYNFKEGSYKLSFKLSELGLNPTNGKLTITGWILNYTLGSITFKTFDISEEKLGEGSSSGGSNSNNNSSSNNGNGSGSSSSGILDIAKVSSENTPNSQNKGATTITTEGGKLSISTASWDGVTYSVWQQTFTAAALDKNLYLNLKFTVSGEKGGSRFNLEFNEGKAHIAKLVKDDFDTIEIDEKGNYNFKEGSYEFSIKLSDLGLTDTNGKLTMTGWVLNYTKGTITFDTFEISDKAIGDNTPTTEESEPAVESKPADESKPAVESKPADESKPAVESKPADESKPAVESKPADESKPAVESKPADESEVIAESAPTDESEVIAESTPAEESEFIAESAPTDESEVITESTPTDESEVITESTPAEESNAIEESIGEDKDGGSKVLLIVGIAVGVIAIAAAVIIIVRKKRAI